MMDIHKRDLWLLAAIIVFIVGIGYVIAYNSGAAPSVMGHSAGEIHIQNSSGDIVTLQEFVDQGGSGSGSVEEITPGTWCGFRMSAHGGPVFDCDGHDPIVSCPSDYTPRLFAAMGSLGGNWYTCTKN